MLDIYMTPKHSNLPKTIFQTNAQLVSTWDTGPVLCMSSMYPHLNTNKHAFLIVRDDWGAIAISFSTSKECVNFQRTSLRLADPQFNRLAKVLMFSYIYFFPRRCWTDILFQATFFSFAPTNKQSCVWFRFGDMNEDGCTFACPHAKYYNKQRTNTHIHTHH